MFREGTYSLAASRDKKPAVTTARAATTVNRGRKNKAATTANPITAWNAPLLAAWRIDADFIGDSVTWQSSWSKNCVLA